MRIRRALVRRPSPQLAEGITTHIDRVPVDPQLALAQWEQYVAALASFDVEIIHAPVADDCPDGVFIEDPLFVYGNRALVTNMGSEVRRLESASAEEAAKTAGLACLRMPENAHLDGGDILKYHSTVWCGRSGRTDDAGIQALREFVEPAGATVIPVDITKVLHLKSAITALPDGTIIGYEPLVDEPTAFPKFLAVPEPAGAHVVVIDDQTVLMSASAPASAAMFRERGLNVTTVDISEFEKLEGCVTCLSVRLR